MTITTKIVDGKLTRYIDDTRVGSSKAMDAAAEIRTGKPVTIVAYGNRHKVRVPNLTINTVHSRYNGTSYNVKLSVSGERQLIFSTSNNQRAKEIIASIENLYFAGAELIQVDTAGNVTVTENAPSLHVIETRPDKNGIIMSFVDGKRVGSNDVYHAVTENHRALICNEFAKLGISAATQTKKCGTGDDKFVARIELDDDFLGGWNEFSFETADEAIDAAQKIKAAFGKKFYSAEIRREIWRRWSCPDVTAIATIKPDTDESEAVTEKLPTGTITVDCGAKAFELVAKYFPNGLKFDKRTAWHNGEEQFNFADGNGMYLFATCDRDNIRIESLEVIDTNENGSKRKPLFVTINPPEISEVDDAESQSTNAVPVPKKKGDMTLDEWLDILAAEREIKDALDDYAVTAEAQDVAINAEVELANLKREPESNDEIGKQLPEIKPECKRFGSFKIKAAAVDARLEASTVKPALEALREQFAELRDEIDEAIDDYRNECQDSWVYDGDINDYRGRPSDTFYRYVWDGETYASEFGMVFTLDEDGWFSRDPLTFKTLAEIEERIHKLQRRRHEVGKQIAKLQNAARVEKPAPVDNTERIEDLIDEANEICDDIDDTRIILGNKINQNAPKSELENLAIYIADRRRDYDAVIAELYALTNDKLPEKNPDDYDTDKILAAEGYYEAGNLKKSEPPESTRLYPDNMRELWLSQEWTFDIWIRAEDWDENEIELTDEDLVAVEKTLRGRYYINRDGQGIEFFAENADEKALNAIIDKLAERGCAVEDCHEHWEEEHSDESKSEPTRPKALEIKIIVTEDGRAKFYPLDTDKEIIGEYGTLDEAFAALEGGDTCGHIRI